MNTSKIILPHGFNLTSVKRTLLTKYLGRKCADRDILLAGWLGIYNEQIHKIRLYDYPNLVYPQPFINLLLPKYWRSPDDPSNDPSVLTQSRGENSFAHHKNDFKYVELW